MIPFFLVLLLVFKSQNNTEYIINYHVAKELTSSELWYIFCIPRCHLGLRLYRYIRRCRHAYTVALFLFVTSFVVVISDVTLSPLFTPSPLPYLISELLVPEVRNMVHLLVRTTSAMGKAKQRYSLLPYLDRRKRT